MATWSKAAASTSFGYFKPINSAIDNLANGAGTIAALIYSTNFSASSRDVCGLVASVGGTGGITDWYHSLWHVGPTNAVGDDAGTTTGGGQETPSWVSSDSTWYIDVITWASGTATARAHHINADAGGSWTHSNFSAANGGAKTGPGTTNGTWRIGYFEDSQGQLNIALSACWKGVALSDAQCQELYNNKKTSDWWNCSGGRPDLLIELNTATPTDIGNNPSTFGSINTMTLAGPDPTWTFDGRGSAGYDKHPSDFSAIPFIPIVRS